MLNKTLLRIIFYFRTVQDRHEQLTAPIKKYLFFVYEYVNSAKKGNGEMLYNLI